jgi:hypothetical protein
MLILFCQHRYYTTFRVKHQYDFFQKKQFADGIHFYVYVYSLDVSDQTMSSDYTDILTPLSGMFLR